jgi:hypothetical protein
MPATETEECPGTSHDGDVGAIGRANGLMWAESATAREIRKVDFIGKGMASPLEPAVAALKATSSRGRQHDQRRGQRTRLKVD